MESALDKARRQNAEREARNRERDLERLEALRGPTEDLLKLYAEVGQQMRSRDGITVSNTAKTAIQNGRTQLESLIGEEPPGDVKD